MRILARRRALPRLFVDREWLDAQTLEQRALLDLVHDSGVIEEEDERTGTATTWHWSKCAKRGQAPYRADGASA